MAHIQKIVPFLWFDKEAEEAVNFYISVFGDGKITGVNRYDEESGKASGNPAGSVMLVMFELFGQQFAALNGGPLFKFTEAISLEVICEDQTEVDKYWHALSAVPESEQCGWLKDKFGLSWQIVPKQFHELVSDADPKKSAAVMQTMLQMKKMNIAKLQAAHDNA